MLIQITGLVSEEAGKPGLKVSEARDISLFYSYYIPSNLLQQSLTLATTVTVIQHPCVEQLQLLHGCRTQKDRAACVKNRGKNS